LPWPHGHTRMRAAPDGPGRGAHVAVPGGPARGPPPHPRGLTPMEPVEINAGDWYLRALRADDRIDDRPLLADAGVTDPDHVPRRTRDWAADTRYSWAVCEPTTGELLAEIVLTPDTEAGTG